MTTWNPVFEPQLVGIPGMGAFAIGQATTTLYNTNLPDEWFWSEGPEPLGVWANGSEPAGSWSNVSEPAGSWSDLAEPAGVWTPVP